MTGEMRVSGWRIASSLATIITASVVSVGALIAVAGCVSAHFAKTCELERLNATPADS